MNIPVSSEPSNTVFYHAGAPGYDSTVATKIRVRRLGKTEYEAQELTDGEQFQLYMSFLFLQARYKEPNE